MRRIRAIAIAASCVIGFQPVLAQDTSPPSGTQDNVQFKTYGALARSSEVLARVFTPLTVAGIRRDLARKAKSLSETPIDLGSERFLVSVPREKPAGGYRLLVFVPPWRKAQLPQGWGPVLDAAGVIFVTAARSGNDEDIVSRREPLALIAAQNMLAQYDIDRTKIFVGGMSGGSRMALRLALAYPDLFHGALLNSGSDVIGTVYEPLPPAPLFRQFQTGTRLLYVTGDHDAANVETETRSRRSMKEWCVSDTDSIRMAFTGHEVASAAVLKHALELLLAPDHPDPAALAGCRAQVDADVASRLDQVRDLIANGKRGEAEGLLKDIDAKYGGLAAPRSLELSAALDTP